MDDREPEATGINPGYAAFQIAKALRTAEHHNDAATRDRAQEKADKWADVFGKLLTGELAVGSRTPVSGAPPWATLEVLTGGFATGNLLAGGPISDEEKQLLESIGASVESDDVRRTLNGYFITDHGLADLQELLESGRYDIDVPEEGALLVVAWLVKQNCVDAARTVLDHIAPFFGELRFYPRVRSQPRRAGERVFVQSAGEAKISVEQIGPNARILAQQEAIHVWLPLYDRFVASLLETVAGPPPHAKRSSDGRLLRDASGRFQLEGGWPCQEYPSGWADTARQLLQDYAKLRVSHQRCTKPDDPRKSFHQLREYLSRCCDDPKSLTGKDVGRIRLILGRYLSARGNPGSPEHVECRARQTEQAQRPTHHEIALAVLARFDGRALDDGVDDIAELTRPIEEEQAQNMGARGELQLPPSLSRKLNRCRADSVEARVEAGVITSGDTLARVLPQVTAQIRSAGLADASLRHAYAAIYCAFRRRRSLLLLNLEKQVQLEELPWIAAIDQFRSADLEAKAIALATLHSIAALNFTAFPYAIVPNKLLQEFTALAKTASVEWPLVEEVAADIFMGEFSPKFVRAAKLAGDLLAGKLYATYYAIDYSEVQRMPEGPPRKRGLFRRTTSSDPLGTLCSSRAGVKPGGWDVAVNGMIIEQQQVLTTQNLATLFTRLNLDQALDLKELCRNCFQWLCRRQQMKVDEWHGNLIMLKNTAYAWRQLVFFLSFCPAEAQLEFVAWARQHLREQPYQFGERFSPVVRGLAEAIEGRRPAQVFLGWSKERHWLMPEDK